MSSVPAATVAYLASLEWITARENLCLVGPAGTGKSHLLVALGVAAVAAGHKVRYFTAAELAETLYRGLAYNSGGRVIDPLLRNDLILIDEVGFAPLDDTGAQLLRARHEKALGGLFSQVLRLLAAESMVSLGTLSLDGTKLAGSAANKANRTLPQIEKILAEAAAADADDARQDGNPQSATPRTLAHQAERRERLARARDRLAAEDKACRQAQRAKQEPWKAAAAAGETARAPPGR